MRRVSRLLACALVASATSACEPAVPENVDITELQERVLTPRCAHPACHAGPTPEHDLDLSEGRAIDTTVNVPAVSVDGVVRVVPGRPDESLLYRVTESPVDGVRRMPVGGSLTEYERALLRVWIEEGCR